MKLIISLFIALLWAICPPALAQSFDHQVKVNVSNTGDLFEINASFKTPLNNCDAYRYLTDYAAAKKIPGVLESEVTRKSDSVAIVNRTISQSVLFFSITIKTTIEYTELPYAGADFKQIAGDAKMFKGTWRIKPEDTGTNFIYRSIIEPNTIVPNFIISSYIKNDLQQQFLEIAKHSITNNSKTYLACN
ncbi:hypothetical protein LZG75_01045 [Polynucleobacter sp. IMCC30063]|uniref:SRPBCC family protein n=1 Tax=unclassified Polynucleobacter TaxID=2640945 RepID=UPI001F34B381|nr:MULTISPECIES: SRPBCC family protein [unclassified Polynucleobacter]MCE7504823.1 hypothetical protein [Polynucleobacter sp. IMCC30063]MCE7529659.1 hypothetical protein [Polynucleobacter sp. IMCC 29146]